MRIHSSSFLALLLLAHLPFSLMAQGTDLPAIQPLELKPGFWELVINTAIEEPESSIQALRHSMEQAAAQLPPSQRAAYLANEKKTEEQVRAAAAKGTDKKQNLCISVKSQQRALLAASVANANCTRQVDSSNQKVIVHAACAINGLKVDENYVIERIDPGRFRASGEVRQTETSGQITVMHRKLSATWVRPNCSIEELAGEEPNRVVAVCDGKNLTARQVAGLLAHVSPTDHQQYQSKLPELVQRIYMQNQVAQEAAKLHLDQQAPWKEKLASAHHEIFPLDIGPGQAPPPQLQVAWQNARAHILWEAYFARAPTPEQRKALLEQKQSQFKIQVQDPDFFNGLLGPPAETSKP